MMPGIYPPPPIFTVVQPVEGGTDPADTTAKITELVVLATTLLASLTEKTTFAAAYAAVGVPVTAPVLVLRLNPTGSVPDVML
jgi:hypothetical protein